MSSASTRGKSSRRHRAGGELRFWAFLGAVMVVWGAAACGPATNAGSGGPATTTTVHGPAAVTQPAATTNGQPAERATPSTTLTGTVAAALPVWVLTGTPPAGPGEQPAVHAIVPVDTSTNRAGTPLVLPPEVVFVAIDRQETRAVLLVDSGGSAGVSLVPFSLTTGEARTPIPLHLSGYAVTSAAFSPDDRVAYLVDALDGDIIPVDVAAGRSYAPIAVGPLAACGDVETQAAPTPDGQGIYVEGPSGLFDVDLTTRRSSPPFSVAASTAPGAYGNLSIGLSPNGRTLYVLQSGTGADTLVPVNTNGDAANVPITVPVGDKPAETTGILSPAWDKLFVPSDTTAYVVTFGSVPEQIESVDLTTGRLQFTVNVSTDKGTAACGDHSPVPVSIAAGGQVAVAASVGGNAVHTLSLPGGIAGPSIPVGSEQTLAVLSGAGWPAFWPD